MAAWQALSACATVSGAKLSRDAWAQLPGGGQQGRGQQAHCALMPPQVDLGNSGVPSLAEASVLGSLTLSSERNR